jgi:hypothetical protein
MEKQPADGNDLRHMIIASLIGTLTSQIAEMITEIVAALSR